MKNQTKFFLLVALALVVVAAGAGIATAATTETGTPAWVMPVVAVLAALAYGALGYANQVVDGNDKWETSKFLLTLIISLVVGLIIAYKGLDITIENFNTWFLLISSQTGILYYLNRGITVLLKWYDSWKTGGEVPPTT